jgi:DTW domain-containing protein YfiP
VGGCPGVDARVCAQVRVYPPLADAVLSCRCIRRVQCRGCECVCACVCAHALPTESRRRTLVVVFDGFDVVADDLGEGVVDVCTEAGVYVGRGEGHGGRPVLGPVSVVTDHLCI